VQMLGHIGALATRSSAAAGEVLARVQVFE
jgi:hypothetical protein